VLGQLLDGRGSGAWNDNAHPLTPWEFHRMVEGSRDNLSTAGVNLCCAGIGRPRTMKIIGHTTRMDVFQSYDTSNGDDLLPARSRVDMYLDSMKETAPQPLV
jgi:hypothetical protein